MSDTVSIAIEVSDTVYIVLKGCLTIYMLSCEGVCHSISCHTRVSEHEQAAAPARRRRELRVVAGLREAEVALREDVALDEVWDALGEAAHAQVRRADHLRRVATSVSDTQDTIISTCLTLSIL